MPSIGIPFFYYGLLVRMLVSLRRVRMGLGAVLLGRVRVGLGLVVLARVMVVRGLTMMMRGRFVVCCRVVMMLTGCMFGRHNPTPAFLAADIFPASCLTRQMPG